MVGSMRHSSLRLTTVLTDWLHAKWDNQRVHVDGEVIALLVLHQWLRFSFPKTSDDPAFSLGSEAEAIR
jgi:hypothetical protein